MSVKMIPELQCIHTFSVTSDPYGEFNAINSVAISPDKSKVVTVGDSISQGSQQARTWQFSIQDLSTGQLRNLAKEVKYATHNYHLNTAKFSADGKSIIVGSSDPFFNHFEKKRTCPSISFWKVDTLPVHTVQGKEQGWILSIANHPTERQFATITNSGVIRVWHDPSNTGSLEENHSWESLSDARYPRSPFAITYSSDGRWLGSGGDKSIYIWDALTGKQYQTFSQIEQGVQTIAFSPDGQYLVSGGDQRIKIWDIQTGELKQSFFAHPEWVRGLEITPDNRFLISAGGSKIKLWDLATGELLGILAKQPQSFRTIALSNDATLLVSGSQNGVVKVWQLV
jgi:COMPASS component SWD3